MLLNKYIRSILAKDRAETIPVLFPRFRFTILYSTKPAVVDSESVIIPFLNFLAAAPEKENKLWVRRSKARDIAK